MSDTHTAPSTRDKLIRMANQIATFFETMPEADRAKGVADHINGNWDPRMRRDLLAMIESGEAGLKPLVLQAAAKIRPPKG